MASTSTPSWQLLPPVALEAIFRHLCVSQLVELRFLCRQWNSAICHSPKLMGRFVPRFHGDQTVFRTASLEEQLGMVEISTALFPRALIDAGNVGPIAVSPLWARIGQSIESIEVSCGRGEELSVAALLQMLWVLPSLRSLKLDISSSKLKFDMDDGVKLDQLERLDITVCDGKLVELFSKICSNLKTFKYRGKDSDFSMFGFGLAQPDDVLPIICANQNSLRKISLKDISKNPGTWLKQIPAALRPQLKELTIEFSNYEDSVKKRYLLQLGKAFPAVETLKLKRADLDPKYLEDIGKNMKQLRNLTVCLKREKTNQSGDLKAFLKASPQLENLDVNFRGQGNAYNKQEYIDLRGVSCRNLKKLIFSNFSFDGLKLLTFLKGCSNVRHLVFDDIYTFDMDSAVRMLMLMKSLEDLQIFVKVNAENNEEDFTGYERYGVMLNVRTVRTNCFAIARCCPNAEVVYLYHDYQVQCIGLDEEVDQKIGIIATLDKLPKAVRVFISYEDPGGSVDIEEDLRYIAGRAKNLKKVYLVMKRNSVSQAARDAFTKALENVADVQIELKN